MMGIITAAQSGTQRPTSSIPKKTVFIDWDGLAGLLPQPEGSMVTFRPLQASSSSSSSCYCDCDFGGKTAIFSLSEADQRSRSLRKLGELPRLAFHVLVEGELLALAEVYLPSLLMHYRGGGSNGVEVVEVKLLVQNTSLASAASLLLEVVVDPSSSTTTPPPPAAALPSNAMAMSLAVTLNCFGVRVQTAAADRALAKYTVYYSLLASGVADKVVDKVVVDRVVVTAQGRPQPFSLAFSSPCPLIDILLLQIVTPSQPVGVVRIPVAHLLPRLKQQQEEQEEEVLALSLWPWEALHSSAKQQPLPVKIYLSWRSRLLVKSETGVLTGLIKGLSYSADIVSWPDGQKATCPRTPLTTLGGGATVAGGGGGADKEVRGYLLWDSSVRLPFTWALQQRQVAHLRITIYREDLPMAATRSSSSSSYSRKVVAQQSLDLAPLLLLCLLGVSGQRNEDLLTARLLPSSSTTTASSSSSPGVDLVALRDPSKGPPGVVREQQEEGVLVGSTALVPGQSEVAVEVVTSSSCSSLRTSLPLLRLLPPPPTTTTTTSEVVEEEVPWPTLDQLLSSAVGSKGNLKTSTKRLRVAGCLVPTLLRAVLDCLDIDRDGSVSWWEWRAVLTAALATRHRDKQEEEEEQDMLDLMYFAASLVLEARHRGDSNEQEQQQQLAEGEGSDRQHYLEEITRYKEVRQSLGQRVVSLEQRWRATQQTATERRAAKASLSSFLLRRALPRLRTRLVEHRRLLLLLRLTRLMARRHLLLHLRSRRTAAVKLQRCARGWLTRRSLRHRLGGVVTAQRLWRGVVARRRARDYRHLLHRLAVLIRQSYRRYKARQRLLLLQRSALVLARNLRVYANKSSGRKILSQKKRERRESQAALAIQTAFHKKKQREEVRGEGERRRLVLRYLALRAALHPRHRHRPAREVVAVQEGVRLLEVRYLFLPPPSLLTTAQSPLDTKEEEKALRLDPSLDYHFHLLLLPFDHPHLRWFHAEPDPPLPAATPPPEEVELPELPEEDSVHTPEVVAEEEQEEEEERVEEAIRSAAGLFLFYPSRGRGRVVDFVSSPRQRIAVVFPLPSTPEDEQRGGEKEVLWLDYLDPAIVWMHSHKKHEVEGLDDNLSELDRALEENENEKEKKQEEEEEAVVVE
eukprot:gene10493-11624_t